MKYIKILHSDRFVREHFGVFPGEEYQVQHEMQGEQKYGYLINCGKKSIVIYKDECIVQE